MAPVEKALSNVGIPTIPGLVSYWIWNFRWNQLNLDAFDTAMGKELVSHLIYAIVPTIHLGVGKVRVIRVVIGEPAQSAVLGEGAEITCDHG